MLHFFHHGEVIPYCQFWDSDKQPIPNFYAVMSDWLGTVHSMFEVSE